jgi:hypothetical protein
VPPAALAEPGARVVARADLDAVVVVELGHAVVAVGPPAVTAAVAGLDAAALSAPATLIAALARWRPRVVAEAALRYADTLADGLPAGDSRPATSADIDGVRAACPPDEWAESGLDAMRAVVTAPAYGDRPGALAGYDAWPGGIAHVGVVTAPGRRRAGLGASVAAAVTRAALRAGLVPQWRDRRGNAASGRLAARLGYVTLGGQLVVEVARG